MLSEVLLALAASFFTAMASVAQRRAAAPAPGELSFSWRLVSFLLHRPIWFLGILSMIAGFLFQVAALRVGSLTLVQPIIATELLFVFAFVAVTNRGRVGGRDWLSAIGMAVGLGCFLFLANPSGGSDHATARMWVYAGLSTFVFAGLLTLLAHLPLRGEPPSSSRKAALLAIAAATALGFVAAVIKELSVHISQGPAAVFENWSPYVLIVTGAAAIFLASNAFQAGTLAASQPGLTIVDPLVSSALGVVLFGEEIRHGPFILAGEAVALAVLVGSVILLSRSPLVHDTGAVTAGSEVAGGGTQPAGDLGSTGSAALGVGSPDQSRGGWPANLRGDDATSDAGDWRHGDCGGLDPGRA